MEMSTDSRKIGLGKYEKIHRSNVNTAMNNYGRIDP